MNNGIWAVKNFKKEVQKYTPRNSEEFIGNISLLLPLLNTLTNIVFFVKDEQARYRVVNDTLIKRSGLNRQEELLGQTTEQVFGEKRGKEYLSQDLRVLNAGYEIQDNLELHSYVSGEIGWCFTHKFPIYSFNKKIIAMVGISIDVDEDNERILRKHGKLATVESFIKHNIDQKLSVTHLAELVGLSQSQLERDFKAVLKMSPLQFIQKIRLEHAIKLLSNRHLSITNISLSCGYSDHSAFSRQFKQLTGLSPSAFRTSYLSKK